MNITLKTKLENYLENNCCFRDYEIKEKSEFGNVCGSSTVNQVVELGSLEIDVEDAIRTFFKDGYNMIIFYI